jgi:hypothetical protein
MKKLIAILFFISLPAWADTIPDCVSLSSGDFSAPVPDSFNKNIYEYSFYVSATITNGCPNDVTTLGDTGISLDQQAYSVLFPFDKTLAPGESDTWNIAGIVWLPGTPQGYVWNGFIFKDGLTASFSASAQGSLHVSCSLSDETCTETPIISLSRFSLAEPIVPAPEPETVILLSTGLLGVLWKLKK